MKTVSLAVLGRACSLLRADSQAPAAPDSAGDPPLHPRRVGLAHPLRHRLRFGHRHQSCRGLRSLSACRFRRAARRDCRSQQQCHVQVIALPRHIRQTGRCAPRRARHAGPALSAQSLRRSRRPLQRNVRLGQFFYCSWTGGRPQRSARQRHRRQLPLRSRALRRGAQRQPHLLPHALAAAVSHLDDPRGL